MPKNTIQQQCAEYLYNVVGNLHHKWTNVFDRNKKNIMPLTELYTKIISIYMVRVRKMAIWERSNACDVPLFLIVKTSVFTPFLAKTNLAQRLNIWITLQNGIVYIRYNLLLLHGNLIIPKSSSLKYFFLFQEK